MESILTMVFLLFIMFFVMLVIIFLIWIVIPLILAMVWRFGKWIKSHIKLGSGDGIY